MLITEFQYLLEISSAAGRVVGQRRVEPDWSAAVEGARFACWRRAPEAAAVFGADAVISPLRRGPGGLPFASGFRVTLTSAGDPIDRCDFPITYFGSRARAVTSEMVASGLLQPGEAFQYRLLAIPRDRSAATTPSRPQFSVEEVAERPALKAVSHAAFLKTALPCGEMLAGDLPVFIPQQILEEASELTERAGAVEAGGILIGHLTFDRSIPDLGVQVTAQIPARHARGEVGKLTFTAETWAAVQAALSLRRSDERILGWWHCHPAFAWCAKSCPPERRRSCPLMQSFFSGDDVCLHETVFPSAFHTALVVTNTTSTREGLRYALFGWDGGTIRQRGFHILGADRPWQAVTATISEGDQHAPACK